MNCTLRYWARIVAINISATMLATIAFSGVSWHTPWRNVVEAFSVSFTFSTCCSTLCAAALPVLVPAASRRFGFPLNWVAIAGALVGFAIITLTPLLLQIVQAVVLSFWLPRGKREQACCFGLDRSGPRRPPSPTHQIHLPVTVGAMHVRVC